jgi:ABC-2 type transport system permease protein
MIFLEITRTHWTKFRRDRAAFIMTFVVPIAFFSIFATLYGGRPGGGNSSSAGRVRLAVIDEARNADSQQFVARMQGEKSLTILSQALDEDGLRTLPMTAAVAEREIRKGDLAMAVILPKDFRLTPAADGKRPRVSLLADTSDPFSSRIAGTLMQKLMLGKFPLEVQTRDVLGETKKNPRVAFAAAGLGVMFLLFVAASSGGALLDEAESGTLDRILSSHVSMTDLLLGKAVYLISMSTLQLTITFTWASLLFGVELWKHLGGFLLVTVATGVATSGFGLMLATVCRTRAQLSALSTLVVLMMSALGGSLFPRFLMPDSIKRLGLLTINGWALEGFLKVFWREEALFSLWPQLAVLVGIGTSLFLVARYKARRWEAA